VFLRLIKGNDMENFILKGRLNGKQRNRLKGLFDTMYSPRELAEEIGFHIDQVYAVYVPMGCPHERDKKNHILINGEAFARWYGKTYAKAKLAQDETFCKTCRKGVKIIQPERHTKNDLVYLLSVCPVCGRKLTKIIERIRRANDF
jgi:hypothetical protein